MSIVLYMFSLCTRMFDYLTRARHVPMERIELLVEQQRPLSLPNVQRIMLRSLAGEEPSAM